MFDWPFWLFWAGLGLTLWLALLSRKDSALNAAMILTAHQAGGVIAAAYHGTWTVWAWFCLTSMLALPLCRLVLPMMRERWTRTFALGFVVLFGINFTAYMLPATTTLPNWFSTIVLYAMMALISWRYIRERAWGRGLFRLADPPRDARLRPGLGAEIVHRNRTGR